MDDLIINDRGGYSLYGFDIEWTADGDYIIAGTGVSAPSATSSKFGFVLSVASNLSAGIIHWGRKYMTGGIFSERQYDSFNDILPIKGRSQFLLTGSGATPNGEQMITNDLIDQAGNSVWSNPIGHYEGVTSYNNFGIRALYDGNQFYILYPGVENIPSIMILDGSGIFVSAVNIHNHAYPITNEVNVLLNGMEWNGESTIVLSGYYIDFQAPYTGWPLQIHWAGGPSSAWIKYQAPFDGNALKNVSVDFMVRPINYSNPSFPHMINQIYYQPKALITTTSGLAFAAPYQSASAPNIFDLSFLKTGSAGDIDCIEVTTGGDRNSTLTAYTNFISQSYQFFPIGSGAQAFGVSLSDFITCGQPQPIMKPSMGTYSLENNATGIAIYPNPVTDHLNISGLSNIENATITLYDFTGRKVIIQSKSGNENAKQLSVSKLQNGIYFLQISSDNSVIYQEKIMIVKE